jgi:HEAT repeat protein
MTIYRQSLHSIGCFVTTMFVLMASVRGDDAPKAEQPKEKEAELIAVLRSDAPPAEKAITCKRLAIYGSSSAVPELAKLLPDEHLSSWARIALEAIPGSEADEVLIEAVGSVRGRQLIGVINSLGIRRAEGATNVLSDKLQEDDIEIASAAAVALGHIGNAEATKVLRKALETVPDAVRSAVAEGCILCAEAALAYGRDAEAIEIFDEVRKSDVPRQRILEATRGAILARRDAGLDLLVEQLRSNDRAMFRMGLSTAREFPGTKVDQTLAAELADAAADRAALLLHAMADRKETVVLPAVLQAAERGPTEVRLVALGALGRIGNASCLKPLVDVALESDEQLVVAAKAALADLPGEEVDAEIVKMLNKAEGKTYPLMIELVGLRRIDAVGALRKALTNPDKVVRTAALRALGETVSADDLPVLISHAISPKHPEDASAAQQALMTASVRMPDREACAAQLAAALEKSPSGTKVVLLEILGAVAGTTSLKTIAAAAKSDDPQLQDVSTRLLGEWLTTDAAPVLLDLSQTIPAEKFRTRALRGYIRIARQFVKDPKERLEMCRQAFEASRQPAEQRLILELLKRDANLDALKLAIQATRDYPEVKDEATQTMLAIAQKIENKSRDVTELLEQAGLGKVKLQIIKAEYGAGGDQKDVTDVLKKAAADLPLITLPANSYNESFGGDPAPGKPKKLTIHYRMNDKEGEASFVENALIILTMPK